MKQYRKKLRRFQQFQVLRVTGVESDDDAFHTSKQLIGLRM